MSEPPAKAAGRYVALNTQRGAYKQTILEDGLLVHWTPTSPLAKRPLAAHPNTTTIPTSATVNHDGFLCHRAPPPRTTSYRPVGPDPLLPRRKRLS